MISIVFIFKISILIGLIGLIASIYFIGTSLDAAYRISKGKFHFVKQRVLYVNAKENSIDLDVGKVKTSLCPYLTPIDYVYVVYENIEPVMVYKINDVILSDEIAHHVLSQEDTQEFIEMLNFLRAFKNL